MHEFWKKGYIPGCSKIRKWLSIYLKQSKKSKT